jgi:serine/threonine-protein kinase
LNLQCTAPAPELDPEVRRGLPRGVEDMLFAMLEKKPEDRPATAKEVIDRFALFRAASGDAPPRTSSPKARRDRERISAAPPTPRMENAPEKPKGDTMPSNPAAKAKADEEKKEKPRTDTIALVAQNATKARDVPTWLAIVAIVALSLVAGMTTYLVRLKSSNPGETPPPATASAKR